MGGKTYIYYIQHTAFQIMLRARGMSILGTFDVLMNQTTTIASKCRVELTVTPYMLHRKGET